MGGGYLRRLRRATWALVLAVIVASLEFVGAFEGFDRALLEWRYRALSHRVEPSLVVVDIDARSLAEIGRWPFARRQHAVVVDRLLAAGARDIAIDVDFGLPTTSADDAALSEALRRAGGRAILPVFVQPGGEGGRLVENRPLPQFAEGAQLAAVNIAPEADGRVWRYPVAAALPSGFRPSMAVRLAGTSAYGHPSFLIDYAIAAGSLQRIPFVDVLEGRADLAQVAGRGVLIGATALELGDLRAVPVAGNLPSVVVQALAHESIVRGRMLQATGMPVTLLGLGVIVVLLTLRRGRGPAAWVGDVALVGTLGAAVIAGSLIVQAATPLVATVGAWLAMLGAWLLATMIARVETLAELLQRRRRAMLRTRALVDAVVADSFDGVLVVAPSGVIELANPAAATLLGRSRGELVGAQLAQVWPAAAEMIASPGDRSHAEIAHRRPDGQDRMLDIVANRSMRPVDEPARQAPLHLINFRDVTERHRSRVALGLAHERAQQASRLKSQFLATMSHELRTPLNAIMGFSELIRDGRFGNDVARYREYAADIHVSGEHLLQVINDILDLSRIEVGQIEIRRELVDLGAVLQTCATMVRDLAQRQQVGLTVDLPPPGAGLVVADVLRMRQIVLNLLSNAIKFTLPPGSVSASVLRPGPDRVVIEVVDTGIGMSAEEVAIALQPFRQVDSRLERRFGGAGLGLPIAKALAELQGGSLEIESAPGQGTRVRVVIEAARVDRAVA
ncbi:MAG: CHASE2 domain-containing protein [Alphaproteobacteria bacterium]|nr:CHASE2 domain-containing protein [Alphaproteobacteria bacterium]